MTAERKIRKITKPLFVEEPLLFSLLLLHDLVENPNISFLRVGRGMIEFNPGWVLERDEQELLQYLIFELIRILLKHPYKRIKPNKEMSYLASNIAIDEITDLAVPVVALQEIAGHVDLSDKPGKNGYFEYYYGKLMEAGGTKSSSSSENLSAKLSHGGGGAGEGSGHTEGNDTVDNKENLSGGGSSNSDHGSLSEKDEDPDGVGKPYAVQDSDLLAECTVNWIEDDLWNEKIEEEIVRAGRAGGWGSLSDDIREVVRADLQPEVDYRYMLKIFKRTLLNQQTELTRMRPSRRFGFEQLGKKRICLTSLAIYVDVSGSVGSKDLKMMLSVCKKMFQFSMQKMHVYFFDSRVQNGDSPLVMKKAMTSFTLSGRAGTNGQVCVEHFYKQKNKYDGMIMLTDGEMPQLRVRNRRDLFMLFNTRSMWSKCLWKDAIGKNAYVINWK